MNKSKADDVAGGLADEILADLPSVPPSAKVGFVKAVGYLFGGVTNYIAAWARRPTQSVDDKTDAKSELVRAVAKAAANSAAANPEIVEAAMQAWLPKELRRQENKAKVVEQAALELSSGDGAPAPSEEIKDDWLNAFERYCEDASSDKMRQLWGRVLAGEVSSPGSFSKATIRFLAELEIDVAKSFEKVSREIIGANLFILNSDEENSDVDALLKLEAAGLISGVGGYLTWSPPLQESGIFILSGVEFGLAGHVSNDEAPTIQTMAVTAIGQQIMKIVPAPDERTRLVEIAKSLEEKGNRFLSKAEITGVSLCKVIPDGNGGRSLRNLELIWGEDPFAKIAS